VSAVGRQPPPTASGGCFSYGFIARGFAGQEVFVKVLDIRLNSTHADPLKDLEIRIQRHVRTVPKLSQTSAQATKQHPTFGSDTHAAKPTAYSRSSSSPYP
jgi:hypothetical protein